MSQLMTVQELGSYLRFSRRSLYRLMKEDGLPGVKIGNKWRFDRDTVDRWLRHRMAGARARILVIDDDEFVRDLLREMLARRGHTVVTAGSSAEGIQCVAQGDFDLVFLDLKMPEMDGAETLKRIRGIAPELPVTIITGYPDSQMMATALKQGPFAVMQKPFSESDIITAVNSYLFATQARR